MATDIWATKETQDKEYEEKTKAQAETKKAEVNTQIDQNIASAEKNVGEQIKTTEQDYLDIVASNDLQRELDKRQIAETMANLGLTKSGLNATQQTAVQLSAGNKNYAALQQRQKAVDTLRQSLEEYRTQMTNKLRESEISIDEATQKAIADYNANTYKTATEAETERYKADLEFREKQLEAQQKKDDDVQDVVAHLAKNGVISLPDYKKYQNGEIGLEDIGEENKQNDTSITPWSWTTTAYMKNSSVDTNNWGGWFGMNKNDIDEDDVVFYYQIDYELCEKSIGNTCLRPKESNYKIDIDNHTVVECVDSEICISTLKEEGGENQQFDLKCKNELILFKNGTNCQNKGECNNIDEETTTFPPIIFK